MRWNIFTPETITLLTFIFVSSFTNCWANEDDQSQEKLDTIISSMSSVMRKMDELSRILDQSKNRIRPKNCQEIQRLAAVNSDIFKNTKQVIYPFGPEGNGVSVRCDFETDGGGWTIIQRRVSGPKYEFEHQWTEYENGFGSIGANYWIGLKVIHALTSGGDQQELRVDLEDWEGDKKYARYRQFSVGNGTDFYRLVIGGYSGNAKDSMAYHNNMQFSTIDADHDLSKEGSCAQRYHGGWWYNYCPYANLNGYYSSQGETVPVGFSLRWYHWKGLNYSMEENEFKNTEMKIRVSRQWP